MATKKDSDDLERIMNELYIDIKFQLIYYEESNIEWERELFEITKNLYEQHIEPVLLEKITTKTVDQDFILFFIFRQILIEAQHRLDYRDTYFFEYQTVKDNKGTLIFEQLFSQRTIVSLKKKEADDFVRMLLTVPAMLVHYLQTNNSKWREEYFVKNQELLKLESAYNRPQNIPTNRITPSEKEILIEVIKKKKNELRKKQPGKKISIRSVARELGIADSSFRDRLKDHKINFSDL